MMKHNLKISTIVMTAASACLLTAGCSKWGSLNEGTAYPLSFGVNAGGMELNVDGGTTKADNRKQSTSTIDEFTVTGYTGTKQWFPETTVNTSSMTYNDYRWKPDEEHTFYAYANLPSGSSYARITSSGIDGSIYNISDQSKQQDFLLGYYKGKGDKGKASIQFCHLLAALAFKVGTITNVTAIKDVKLNGVYVSGGFEFIENSGVPMIVWTDCTASTGYSPITQSMTTVTTFTAGTAIGDPYILVPQNFSSKNLDVEITVTVGGVDKTITATLKTGSITAGKTTTYAINYDGGKGLSFSTPTVTAWGSTGDPVELELEEEVSE